MKAKLRYLSTIFQVMKYCSESMGRWPSFRSTLKINFEAIVAAARDILDDLIFDLVDRPFIYVTIMNDAFEEIMMNWMCNVKPFEVGWATNEVSREKNNENLSENCVLDYS